MHSDSRHLAQIFGMIYYTDKSKEDDDCQIFNQKAKWHKPKEQTINLEMMKISIFLIGYLK